MIIKAFENINCWSSGDSRDPNKPLLLLIALAKVRRGERWLEFEKIEGILRQLLLDFGPPRQSPHPEYPFWRLLRDGLWDIPLQDKIGEDLTNQGDAKVRNLRTLGAKGGFKKRIFDALRKDPALLKCCAQIPVYATHAPAARTTRGPSVERLRLSCNPKRITRLQIVEPINEVV